MKKIKLPKKAKFLLGLTGFAAVAVVLPATLLTSCSSTANPYGPYTIINQSSQMPIYYNTKKQDFTVFNKNNMINVDNKYVNNQWNNQWINSQQILNYYDWLGQQNTQEFLYKAKSDNSPEYETLKEIYIQDSSSASKLETDKLNSFVKNANGANYPFLYGVAPSEDMKKIATLYNYLTIEGNIFKLVAQMSNELLAYALTTEYSDVYNWLANGQPGPNKSNALALGNASTSTHSASTYSFNSLETQNDSLTPTTYQATTSVVDDKDRKTNAQDFANNSIFQLNTQIKNNPIAKEMVIGYSALGQGRDTYHLWPSGFSAKISVVPASTSEIGTTSVDNINKPYPIINGDKGPQQFTINVSDIVVNYQWYKANKNGGDYVTPDSTGSRDINKHIDGDQKLALSNSGESNQTPNEKDGYIHHAAYQLPISGLNFNVAPMTSTYVDPIYPYLKDYVYNGIYTIQPALQFVGNTDTNFNTTTPNALLSRGDDHGIAWQAVNSTAKNINGAPYNDDKNLSIGQTLIQQIKAQNLPSGNMGITPYYYSNAEGWSANKDYEWAGTIANSSKQNLLTYYQMKTLIDLFANPYGKSGVKVEDRPYYNNFDNVPEYEFTNLWAFGWMLQNANDSSVYKNKDGSTPSKGTHDGKTSLTNQINPIYTSEFKEMAKTLKSEGMDKYLFDTKNNSDIQIAKKGLEAYYNFIKISQIKAGNIYQVDSSNGDIKATSSDMPNPNKNTTTTTPSTSGTQTSNKKNDSETTSGK